MNNWTTEWPTEEGMYWAYGCLWGDERPRLCHCEVHKGSGDNSIYVCKGHFLFKRDTTGAVKWQKITPPELPA
jgi:hypothetical protein